MCGHFELKIGSFLMSPRFSQIEVAWIAEQGGREGTGTRGSNTLGHVLLGSFGCSMDEVGLPGGGERGYKACKMSENIACRPEAKNALRGSNASYPGLSGPTILAPGAKCVALGIQPEA